MREHGEALEVDLLRLGIDLPRDLGTERLTWRRLELLIRHLPRDSATVRRIHGPPPPWSVTDHLLASVIDVLRWQGTATRRTLADVTGAKGQREDFPKPIRRPGDEQQQQPTRRVVRPGELARMMGSKKRAKRRRNDV